MTKEKINSIDKDPFGLRGLDFSVRIPEESEMFNPEEARIYIDGCDYPETSDYAIVAARLDTFPSGFGGVKDKEVLEICSGPGALAHEIWLLGAKRVIGLDRDEIMIEHASEKYGQIGQRELRFQLGSVYEMPFTDSSFDIAVSQNSWHQLFEPQKAIQEMRRVLRPDGFGLIRDFQRGCDEAALQERLKHTKLEIVPLLLDSILASFTQGEFDMMIRRISPTINHLIINTPDPRGLSEKTDHLIAIDPVPHWMDHLISQDVCIFMHSKRPASWG